MRLDVKAEWACDEGTLSSYFAEEVTYVLPARGIFEVRANVGELTASERIKAFGRHYTMSGSGDIPDVKHAVNFKNGSTDDQESADMILLNQYHPDTPYYATANKLVFANGFYPVEFDELQEVLHVDEEVDWVNEVLLNVGPGLTETIKGIVRNRDGSYTKLIGCLGCQTSNGEPDYLHCWGYYNVTDTTTFEY